MPRPSPRTNAGTTTGATDQSEIEAAMAQARNPSRAKDGKSLENIGKHWNVAPRFSLQHDTDRQSASALAVDRI